jgi:hypothetical protein
VQVLLSVGVSSSGLVEVHHVALNSPAVLHAESDKSSICRASSHITVSICIAAV